MYDEGEDASKGVYVSKMDELRALAGPIVQRHFEKVEAERQALQERLEAEKAAKKIEDDARKAAEAEKAAQEGTGDEEMKDADGAAQAEVEENGDPK